MSWPVKVEGDQQQQRATSCDFAAPVGTSRPSANSLIDLSSAAPRL